MMSSRFLLFPILLCVAGFAQNQVNEPVFLSKNGKVHFKSDAPLETIEARSGNLQGVIDAENRTFAFTIDIKSFQGFNSPLQQEDFFENYMKVKKYPKATFTGKIIETVDLSQDGAYTVRAKGKLDIHGVSRERIIKSDIVVKGSKLHLQSTFTVLLQEHDITIPKIVYQKIAEEIQVNIETELVSQ